MANNLVLLISRSKPQLGFSVSQQHVSHPLVMGGFSLFTVFAFTACVSTSSGCKPCATVALPLGGRIEHSSWQQPRLYNNRLCLQRDLVPTCRELGIAFLAYSPMSRGLLTANFTMEENDYRRNLPRFAQEAMQQVSN